MVATKQPFLHDAAIALRAPSQAWSRPDGTMAAGGIDGFYTSDVRIVSELELRVAGSHVEHIGAETLGADAVRFVAVLRDLDAASADPRVRLDRDRVVRADGLTETLRLSTALPSPVTATVSLRLRTDLAAMDAVKAGLVGAYAPFEVENDRASWSDGAGVDATLEAPGAVVTLADGGTALLLTWTLRAGRDAPASASFSVTATDAARVVRAPDHDGMLAVPAPTGDARVDAWLAVAVGDVDALRLALPDAPGDVFLAAGAPWFLTLFGRDSIWAARLLLPLDTALAAGTLRVLARLQGTASVAETAEQPGKIVHELRRSEISSPGEGFVLPPRYYGTVDATPLWILLLHDAWSRGLPLDEVRALLPNLRAALAWMRDFGDSDGDGFLEYVDATGHGLANQGWKDSGDSVQWRDGRLAEGPIALCEVQGYAHEAAQSGAALLDALGEDGGDAWRAWATALRAAFRSAFWIDDGAGGYPAIALDADKRRVDTLTSNIGHLLGTGLLDAADEDRVAALLVDPRLSSGFGLRTMATDSAGFWPLSYHGGSVWAHDTAIAISGLLRSGHPAEAADLAAGLLRAATAFDYRMPELHSGDRATPGGAPPPYPAACRPQAWSAAAAVVAAAALVPSSSRTARTPQT